MPCPVSSPVPRISISESLWHRRRSRSGRISTELIFYASTGLTVVIMLLMLHLSPLSGYHAAEHMTVHAIEAGEALTPEAVRRMPRVHPRCGTNLMAAASVFLIITSRVGDRFGVLLALIVVMLSWRRIGGWLQYVVTTKPPTDRQLENGIAAGEQLIDRYQERPNYQVSGFKRVWNIGFLQVALGMGSTLAFFTLLQTLLHFRILG